MDEEQLLVEDDGFRFNRTGALTPQIKLHRMAGFSGGRLRTGTSVAARRAMV